MTGIKLSVTRITLYCSNGHKRVVTNKAALEMEHICAICQEPMLPKKAGRK